MQTATGDERSDWFLRRAQLALAVAVIRNKPAGRTGRQHAEHLALRLAQQEANWESRAHLLEEQVVQLRHELLLVKASAKLASGDEQSQDTTWDRDSGFETGNNSELLQSNPHSQPSKIPFVSFTSQSTQDKAVLAHTQFLQSLLGLQKLDSKRLETASEHECSVVTELVCQLLSCFTDVWEHRVNTSNPAGDHWALPPAPLLCQASQIAAQVLDSSCRSSWAQFLKPVEDCLEKLTKLLLKNDQVNRFQTQETLAQCLVLLGGSSLLQPRLSSRLLYHICSVGEHLHQSKGLGQLDVTQYENCFYLLWILEQMSCAGGCIDWEEPPELDRLTLQLSDEFPLLAIYLWRVRTRRRLDRARV